MDSRYYDLARVLTHYSTDLQKGESVLIDAYDIPEEMTLALVRTARERGAIPVVELNNARIMREIMLEATDAQLKQMNKQRMLQIKNVQAYIGLRGSHNIFEASDVPPEKMRNYLKLLRPWTNWRVNKTRWVVLRWPHPAMAQLARTSTEAFEDFYFTVCTMDYSKLIPGQNALKKLIDATDQVQIKGPGTDLRFSIKGLEAIMSHGKHNIPDGEVFTAPVKNSVEGEITYNVPAVYQGDGFDQIHFKFQKGRIVEASCPGNDEKINQILDADAGSRYIGEFAIGVNPYINEPMRDTLFDEKIAGSFHFTPGQAYEGVADNGNRSQVHWDIVNIQRPDYGGGEMWFDGKLIRKDGLFVPKSLQKLNPDHLLSA